MTEPNSVELEGGRLDERGSLGCVSATGLIRHVCWKRAGIVQGTGLNYGVGYLQDVGALGTVNIDPATQP